MGKKYCLFCIILFLLYSVNNVSGSNNETLPSYHWAYQYIEELQARGLFLDLLQMNKPYTRGDVAESILESEKMLAADKEFSGFYLNKFSDLKREFEQELEVLQGNKNSDISHLHTCFNLRGDALIAKEDVAMYRGVYRAGIGIKINENVYGYSGVIFDQYDYYNQNYQGYKWRGFVGYTEQGYITAVWKNMQLKLGRDFLNWGVGESGSLLLSNQTRPLDQFFASAKFGPFKFSYIASALDPFPGNVNRYLSGHRLDMTLFRGRIQVAFSEVVIYGGENEGFNFVYMNPVIFYHGAKKNGAGDNNVLPTIDLVVYPKLNWQVYGSLLIDDVQVEKTVPGDLEPDEIGMIAGSKYSDPFSLLGLSLNAEYVRIVNRTYKTPTPHEIFTHRGVPLGHPMGNDFDHLQIGCSYWFRDNLWMKLDYFKTRNGEGDLFSPWDEPWLNYTLEEGYSEPFPTGVVEKRNGVTFEMRWYLRNWLRVNGTVNYSHIKNENHAQGKKGNVFNAKIRIEVDWNKKWEFN